MTWFAVLAPMACMHPVAAAPRQAVALTMAPGGRLGTEVIRTLCPRLPVPCNPAAVTAWVRKGDTAGPLYLIDAERPMFVVLDALEPLRVERARQWDFHAYVHSKPPSADGGAPEPLHIHPALYPVGVADWAVAVVSESREMYSGGGALFQVADFVLLEAPPRPLYAAVPFSCSQLIRACFSEREYRRSRHCHDESRGHVTIRVDQARAAWTFTWHQTDWPAHVPRRRQTHTRTPFQVAPGATPLPSASFCGGPFN